MTDFNKLNLDEQSLMFLLNLILSNLGEERRLALDHHSMLSDLINEIGENPLMLNDVADSVTKFLSAASMSTEKAIKIAKIMADILIKVDTNESLSDEDRASIEHLLGGFEDEKEEIDNLSKNIEMDRPDA